jgi:hypothetical protein
MSTLLVTRLRSRTIEVCYAPVDLRWVRDTGKSSSWCPELIRHWLLSTLLCIRSSSRLSTFDGVHASSVRQYICVFLLQSTCLHVLQGPQAWFRPSSVPSPDSVSCLVATPVVMDKADRNGHQEEGKPTMTPCDVRELHCGRGM